MSTEQKDKTKPVRRIVVTVSEGVPRDAVDLLRAGTETLDTASKADAVSEKQAFAAARRELTPYSEQAARLIPELEELQKELDPFLAKIINTNWGHLQLQYGLNASMVGACMAALST